MPPSYPRCSGFWFASVLTFLFVFVNVLLRCDTDTEKHTHHKCGTQWALKTNVQASLVASRLRVRLPVRGIWVLSLVREDPGFWGAAEPVHPTAEPVLQSPCSARGEAVAPRESPRTAVRTQCS